MRVGRSTSGNLCWSDIDHYLPVRYAADGLNSGRVLLPSLV